MIEKIHSLKALILNKSLTLEKINVKMCFSYFRGFSKKILFSENILIDF